ncbi:MAG TPA: hypothetical protein VF737_12015 [Gemmatimonadaceae bacterium]
MTAPETPSRPAAPRASLGLPGWVAAGVVFALAVHAMNPYPVGVLYDDAVYVELGKAIAGGAGLHYLHLPGTPPATHFPPGYPLLLALLWRLWPAFPDNVLLFKAVNALLVAVAALWLARMARERFGCARWQAAVAAVVLGVGVPTLVLSNVVMSEPLFLALALPALLLAERVGDAEGPLARAALAGVLAGIATLVRTQGVALVAALVAVLLWRRRYRQAAGAAGAAAVVLAPWAWWVHTHSGGLPAPARGIYGPYLTWYVDAVRAGGIPFLATTLAGTIRQVADMLEVMLAAFPSHAVGVAALVLAVPLAALGAWRARAAAPVTLAFLAFFLAIALVWPYSPIRFLFAVWPLLAALPLLGVVALWRRELPPAVPRMARMALLVLSVVPLAGYTVYTARGYRGHWWGAISRQRAMELVTVIRAVRTTVPANAVVCGRDDAAIYLYTGRQAVPFAAFEATDFSHPPTKAQNAQDLRAMLASYHPDRVVVTTQGQLDVADILAGQHPPLLAMADSFPGGFIYAPTKP